MCRRCPLVAVLLCALSALPATNSEAPQVAFSILVTNSDGVRAPGLAAIVRALRGVGPITVVAPDQDQTGTGHSVSFAEPIYSTTVTLADGTVATALSATPASCVKVAFDAPLVRRPPDLVVSGVNRGYSLGLGTYASGAIGAVREAALRGIPAIAISIASSADPHYEAAADIAARLASQVRVRGLERGAFLNVNVPPGTLDTLRDVRLTAQSTQAGTERFEEQAGSDGRRYFWSISQGPRRDVEGTDVWAVSQGFVSVTPLRIGEFDPVTFQKWKSLKW